MALSPFGSAALHIMHASTAGQPINRITLRQDAT